MTSQSCSAFAAIDLGASSGRVMLGTVIPNSSGAGGAARIELEELHRFPNGAAQVAGRLQWNVRGLFSEILVGLRRVGQLTAQRGDTFAGIGIDSWGVDYGLLGEQGELLAQSTSYRDPRTQDVAESVYAIVSQERHYQINGLQTQPFNTEFQLATESRGLLIEKTETILLIPDLLNYWLTGKCAAETTNASTTGLVNARTRQWDWDLVSELHERVPNFPDLTGLLPNIVEAGSLVGELTAPVMADLGLSQPVPVFAVGSHDTASAIVAVPTKTKNFAYISSGTWSLIGIELDAPVLTRQSMEANFTNELGVDGTVRYLRNVMGLWVLQESIRVWQEQGQYIDLPTLISAALLLPRFATIVDMESTRFLEPGDMPGRIAAFARETAQPVPRSAAEFVRCIVDSLALAYQGVIEQVQELSGAQIEVIHIVGGGIQNELLCQLTADATGLEVIAGPIEGAVLGNVLIQARAAGCPSAAGQDLSGLRKLGSQGLELKHYFPQSAVPGEVLSRAQVVREPAAR